MCLPDSTPKDVQDQKCKMHKAVKQSKWEVYETAESSTNWTVVIVIAILILIILAGGVILYYQKMLQKNGRPPFRVPNFCPQRLFPRDENFEELRVIQ